MTREQLDDLLRLFLEENPDWVDINEDTGGWGLCEFASEELVIWLAGRSVAATTIWLFLTAEGALRCVPPRYPRFRWGETGAEHCVAYVEGFMVDLPARQYDEDLPFPFVWTTDEQHIEEQVCPRSR